VDNEFSPILHRPVYTLVAMFELENLGRMLVVMGVVLAAVGLFLAAGGRVPFLGRLPGDISVRWDGGSFYFPLVTCLVVSILLTIGLNLILRLLNRP
jgi:hypothetical protein